MLSLSSLCEPAISLYSLPRLSPILRVYIQYALRVDDHACVSLFCIAFLHLPLKKPYLFLFVLRSFGERLCKLSDIQTLSSSLL